MLVLNSTLFFLFAAATIADHWPNFAVAAGVVAFVAVAIEAYIFWRYAHLPAPSADHALASVPAPAFPEVAHSDLFLISPTLVDRNRDDLRIVTYIRNHHNHDHRRFSAWANAHLREERFQYLNIVKVMERRKPITELEKLKVVAHGNDAFNIVAGAFEIEFFHGRTNIRVLDSSKVTIEGANRGEKLPGLPPAHQPPTYQ